MNNSTPPAACLARFERQTVLACLLVCIWAATPAAVVAQGICDRTPQVRDKLLEITGVSECGKVTSEHLAGVTSWLDLRASGIETLRAGDFDGLSSLTGLLLGGNQLTSLPGDIFRGLSSLEWLRLGGNQLTSLPQGIFRGLSSLKSLDLQNNQLTSLSEDVFSALTSLQVLVLHSNQLTSLPANILSGLSSLENINLQKNQLTSLPGDIFSGLTAMTDLYLHDNQLSSLPEDVFKGLGSLAFLNLHNNQLASLPRGIFSGLSSLEWLRLDGNQLTTLPAAVFDDVLDTLGTPRNYEGDETTYYGELRLDSNLKASLTFASAAQEVPSGATVTIEATLNRALPVSLRVPYAMGGTATVDDYTDLSPAPSDGLLFSAGETVRAITLTLSEGSRAVGKTLTVTLGESSEIKVRRSDGTGPDAPYLKTESLLLRPNEGVTHTVTVVDRPQDYSGDKQVLVALYNATDGANWSNNENWLSDEPLDAWHGVTVSDGRVTQLVLWGNRLTGPIPPDLADLTRLERLNLGNNQLTGPIPPELADLASLEELYLDQNGLTGPIPPELADLAKLSYLTLEKNQLAGPIPPELADLTSLEALILGNNQLMGPIPPELGNLANLSFLTLENNQLTGPIPAELGDLYNLIALNLSQNGSYVPQTDTIEGGVTGPIPAELGSLSSLRLLDLSANQLTGTIPSELGKLSSLIELSLWRNQLTGSIPAELGNLSSLMELNLFRNQLSGPIPREFGNLTNLTVLELSWNGKYGTATIEGGLTGSIPAELGKLANLTLLGLSINRLTGPIPPELGNLSSLMHLRLAQNQLTGTIPSELGDLANLTGLQLSDNQLTGPIPSDLGNLINITSLGLDNNQLTGPIPVELGSLSDLTYLHLGANQLTGTIPTELGNLSNLRILYLNDNQLKGVISPWLENLTDLAWLRLNGNQLTGTIPPWLGSLSRLLWLELSNNQLTGTIPPELGNLDRLWRLDLSNNQLNGAIPPELGKLANLQTLYLNNNQLTGTIPPELGDLSNLSELNLSWNRRRVAETSTDEGGLKGPSPPELGNLSSIKPLNVSWNQERSQEANNNEGGLEGPIPTELGKLSGLTTLRLGGNRLTGPIPSELGNLSNLRALDLSSNQLTAPLPQSFTSLMLEYFYFHGNPGLSVPEDAAFREWLDGIKDVRDQDYSPATPFVPVILSSAGRNNSFFTSELTLTNRGTVPALLTYTYTAHRGGGSGVASDALGPGEQRIIPNAIEFLRNRRVPIPGAGNRIGTLRVSLRGFSSSDVGVTVRTTTRVPEGRAGLAYPAVAAEVGFDEPVYLCGLRQNAQDRSNVAFQNLGTDADGPITLRTTVFSGDPDDSRSRVLEDRTLQPGGFYQYSGLLGVLDSVGGNRQGYVKVERVEGTAPFYAYGVINDQGNSDGSFVFPATASSLMETTGQTLPVIIETGVFTSELMVTNFSDVAKTVTFRFRANAVQTPDKTATVEWTFHPGQQMIVPNIVDMLRKLGAAGIGRAGQTFAGALFATVDEGGMSGIAIGARTSSSDGRGGQYGVYYNAAPYGGAFGESAWVEALQQNEENRSNLAMVNTGEVDDSPSVFQLDIYDGATGMLANTITGLMVPAGGWHQINGILGDYAPGTMQGYVRISRISGNNPFLAYGIINDGGAPGQRSGDGAYLPARE